MNYEHWQLEIIRDGLKEYYKLGRINGSAQCSWREVAYDIEYLTEIPIPAERLRKFVVGEPSKNLGAHRYPVLSNERLEAVVKFLTQENSPGYMFPREDLIKKPIKHSEVFHFAKYFNTNTKAEPRSDMSGLCGLFNAIHEEDDIAITFSLRFLNKNYQGLIPFVLSKIWQKKIINSQASSLTLERPTLDPKGLEKYDGWAILTPEESMLLFAKDNNNENLLYVTLGIDKSLYFSEPANALVLLEIDQPEDTLTVQVAGETDNTETLLNNVREAFFQQLILFKRQIDS